MSFYIVLHWPRPMPLSESYPFGPESGTKVLKEVPITGAIGGFAHNHININLV